jgi:hypothetical protein
MDESKDTAKDPAGTSTELTGTPKDVWRKNRWMLFYLLTWLYLLLEFAIIFLRLSGLHGLYTVYKGMIWPEAVLGMLVVISLAQVMQYFLELPRVVAGVYLYAITNFVIVTIAIGRISVTAVGTISLLPLLYFIICLFRVRAPEVSFLFKWIAALEVLSIGFNISFNSMHLWDNKYMQLLPHLERLMPYVLILAVLTKMKQLPPVYVTTLEKDINSIGEPVRE